MKIQTMNRRLHIAALCFLALAVSANAADVTRYQAKPKGNNVHIDGAANIHNWDMDGSLIGGFLEVPSSLILDSKEAAVAGAPSDGKIAAKGEVSIPIVSILNSKYGGMSEVMQQAMDAANHPDIKFHLSEMTLKQPHAANTPLQFDVKGELEVKGKTNKVSFPVSIESEDKNMLKITASAIPINMPDYGITPPTKFGLFTTEPGVKISFTWNVGVRAKSAAGK